jgi:hypothetical protein
MGFLHAKLCGTVYYHALSETPLAVRSINTYVVVGGMCMSGNAARYVVRNNSKLSSACSWSTSVRVEYELVL